MAQLTAQIFYGLLCVIPSLSYLQGDKMSRVQSLESVAVNSQNMLQNPLDGDS